MPIPLCQEVKQKSIEMGQIYSILFHHRYKVVSARYNLQPLSVEESDHFSSAFNHLQNSGNTNKNDFEYVSRFENRAICVAH